MRRIDKTKLLIFILMRLSIIIAGLIAIFEKNWTALGMSILILIAMLIPSIMEKRFNLDIPSEFEIILIFFIYASLFLGEMHQFYDKFWWWDKMLHSLSGLILGNIGFLIVSYLNNCSKMNIRLSPIYVAIFSFCFAVAMGAIWEIYEYSMDKCFGFFMQRGSLDDTMTDLILDTMGALVFAVLGYFHQKGRINIISKYLVRFDLD
ncbi:MAG TPA: hypothetical protein DDZ91_00670 [Firmicutes bacterium]|jgi:uncharacterized membrane protein YjdF|nr:hypothetical protein [Bacillota bacterium]